MTVAAVLRRVGEPLELSEIRFRDLAVNQVRVRIAACGVCRSDLLMQNGARPHPVPVVLGHEAAGIVIEAGADVEHVRPGDHVVLANSPGCRRCWFCVRGEPFLCDQEAKDTLSMPYADDVDGRALIPAMGIAGFADETTVLGRAAIPIGKDVPLDVAALVSCAVSTGAGAAVNAAGVTEGSVVVILGAGGVGLSALLGALVCRAAEVVVVDPSADRREGAALLGATRTAEPGTEVSRLVAELTAGRGADFCIEASGQPEAINAAYDLARSGGRVVIVGASDVGASVTFSAFGLYNDAKTVLGCQSGSADAYQWFPRLLELWREGLMPCEAMISRRVGLAEINSSLADLAQGRGMRTVIVSDWASGLMGAGR